MAGHIKQTCQLTTGVIVGSLHLWDALYLLYKIRSNYADMTIIAESHRPDILTRK